MSGHVMNWKMGYLLISPLRRMLLNPENILRPYVKSDMNILEIGPGMGFFSIPAAKLIGDGGKIYCIDVQQEMLNVLQKRLNKKGLAQRAVLRKSGSDGFYISDLNEKIDFALLFAVAHEVPDKETLFREVSASLKPGAILLLADPSGHETTEGFNNSVYLAEKYGLFVKDKPVLKGNFIVILQKTNIPEVSDEEQKEIEELYPDLLTAEFKPWRKTVRIWKKE